MGVALGKIFRKPASWLFVAGFGFLLFGLMTLVPHSRTFLALFQAGLSPSVIFAFLGVIISNNTIFSLMGVATIALLTGVYTVVLLTSIKQFGITKHGIGGVGGTVLGLFGVGCTACGSVIFVPLLSALGIAGFFAILPFGGEEFLVVGTLILLVALYALLNKMSTAQVCTPET